VPDELGVEVQGMIWRPQREAEVVHGEDVFEQFRVIKIANAAGLPGVVE